MCEVCDLLRELRSAGFEPVVIDLPPVQRIYGIHPSDYGLGIIMDEASRGSRQANDLLCVIEQQGAAMAAAQFDVLYGPGGNA